MSYFIHDALCFASHYYNFISSGKFLDCLTCVGRCVLPRWWSPSIFLLWWGNNYTHISHFPSQEPSVAPPGPLDSKQKRSHDQGRHDQETCMIIESSSRTWSLHSDFEVSAAGSFGVDFKICHFFYPQTLRLEAPAWRPAGVWVTGCKIGDTG